MSLAAAKIAMQAIVSYTTDESARRLAQEALDELSRTDPDPSPPVAGTSHPLSAAERARRYREGRKRHDDRHGDRHEARDGSSRTVTKTVTPAVTIVTENVTARDGLRDASRARDLDLDLSSSESFQDFLGDLFLEGVQGGSSETVTAVTKTVTATVTDRHEKPSRSVTARVTRKRAKTHCPGPEESTEAIDAWCRSHGLPPASQVPAVDGMLGWHQKQGVPRASWLRTWQDWQRNQPRFDPPASGARALGSEDRGVDREARRRAENAVQAAYRASPEYQADLARARQADAEQAQRARFAGRRGPSEPIPLAGARPKREPTAEELAQRDEQLEALLDEETRKAGGT